MKMLRMTTVRLKNSKIASQANLQIKGFAVFLMLLCLPLAGCATPQATADSQAYSLTASQVANGNFPTTKYELGFLSDQNLTIADSCWLDQNRLMLLAASPSQADETGENNLPQQITIFILYTGDNTLEQVYQGEHATGKLKKVSSNTVAIVGQDNITFFNYTTKKVDNQLEIENGSEDSSRVAISADGRYLAYEDTLGGLMLADTSNAVFAQLNPKDFGFNWLSNPIWSNDSKHLAFFCGYEPYGLNSIGIIQTDAPEKPTILKYNKVKDIFPYWPAYGSNLIVLENFFNNPDNLPIKIELINTETGKSLKSLKLDYYKGFTNLLYANTATNQYFINSDGKLYLQENDKPPILLNPAELPILPDNVHFSEQANKIAAFTNDEAGNLNYVYIINRSK